MHFETEDLLLSSLRKHLAKVHGLKGPECGNISQRAVRYLGDTGRKLSADLSPEELKKELEDLRQSLSVSAFGTVSRGVSNVVVPVELITQVIAENPSQLMTLKAGLFVQLI